MKYVELYKLTDEGNQEVVATFSLPKGSTLVTAEGSATTIISEIEKHGIENYYSRVPAKLFLKDGERFLQQLAMNYKSGYLNASRILQK